MTDHRPAVLCDLIYSNTEPGHGGRHRSLQLREIVEEAGFEAMVMPVTLAVSNVACYAAGLKALLRYRMPPGSGWRWLRRWGRNSLRFRNALKTGKDLRLLLWENTRPVGYLSPLLAREAGLPVYAAPQNIEALARGRIIRRPSDYPLAEVCAEMAALRLADHVDAICQTEQWFMAHHGIVAGFLPYHPPRPVREQMLKVRQQRMEKPDSGRFLIMGTTTNPPTRQGMVALLKMLSQDQAADSPAVDVIGTGTDTMRSEFSHPRFHFHGRVSAEKLDELLAGASATLIHQPLATGALTRVAELLMAGVPVIANPVAARSTGHHTGVHVFEDEAGLLALGRSSLPMPPIPSVPEKVVSIVSRLRSYREPAETRNQ
jgi:glycosyltransferase involved in cell wall biosynthesis